MKKKLVYTMNEELPLIPEKYGENIILPEFKNLEMFNLVKTNLDILPSSFYDKLSALEKDEADFKSRKKKRLRIN